MDLYSENNQRILSYEKTILVLIILLAGVQQGQSAQNDMMKCCVKNLRVRSVPNLNSQALHMLDQGEDVEVLQKKSGETVNIKLGGVDTFGNWVNVKTGNGVTGWVYSGGLSNIAYFQHLKIYAVKNRFIIQSTKNGKNIVDEKISTVIDNSDFGYIGSIQYKHDDPFLVITVSPSIDLVAYFAVIFDLKKNRPAG